MKLREFSLSERWAELELLQKEYVSFKDFTYDVISGLLGFDCSDIQMDIAEYLEHGPKERMIQAQRGQAKTTITACYAVWRIIHDPTTRILIISAGSDMAGEISKWVIQIMEGMEELACLLPDRSIGDRASSVAYDVHRALKGPEKSPSIACIGITSNMQGKRADVLIADDVESAKNSQTETMRDRLRHLTLDFTSICSTGDIIYLGTPQSIDSIYNTLPGRGYSIRIWPGRYPTEEEEGNYGNHLAPLIQHRIKADPSLRKGGGPLGVRGQAVDPVLLPEAVLSKKELDQGAAYFQLQHMLDTRLSDADRYPLKPERLVVMSVPQENGPLEINPLQAENTKVYVPMDFPIDAPLYGPGSVGKDFAKYRGRHMYVDPAGGGQNGDETAYAVTTFLAGRVFLIASGKVKPGLTDESLDELTAIAEKYKPATIHIEKNFGNGALSAVWKPKLLSKLNCRVEDVWESGQKELRIIDILEPVIGSSRLVIDKDVVQDDWRQCQEYPAEKRTSYSLFHQIARITRDKGSLKHDDRLDALAGSVRYWTEALAVDSKKVVEKERIKSFQELLQNPTGNHTTKLQLHIQSGRRKPTATSYMRKLV